ncbi:response regulator [Terribacillus saccharophilus]|uniref:DNA-binding response regulator n=1 Tax=Terribacillus saccharophilus TaxID=361277 RepID=A0ABX4H170_9BACI|nr:response regulator transcription factor [Terribacillus saccharophilus]PAD36442.1 DNA-binding response regulator [Terribacillus saccharophilus]PAD97106.1 DNA-binding response regulator [Terribacillus saccharophilus]PAE00854.1 DNA-binding response regulator [Terribacillus saccharophilus]
MIRIAVIDDHDIVRKGLIAYLETEDGFDVIGQASSGREGVKLVLTEKPDVVLMDLIMEDGTGIEATKEIIKAGSATKIIILTSFYDDEQVFPALEAGAFSYMLKTSTAEQIAESIRKAAKGETVMEAAVAAKVMNSFRQKKQLLHDHLTEREFEVLCCIGKGMTNQEIADKLYIGIKTVKTHVSNTLAKLQVNDRTQAAVYVHQNKLLKY